MKFLALALLAVFAAIVIFPQEFAALLRRLHHFARAIRTFRVSKLIEAASLRKIKTKLTAADMPRLEFLLILLVGYLSVVLFVPMLLLTGPEPEWLRLFYWPTEHPVRVMAAVTASLTVLVIFAWLKVPTEVERIGEQAGSSDSAYMTLTWLAAGLAFLLFWFLPKAEGQGGAAPLFGWHHLGLLSILVLSWRLWVFNSKRYQGLESEIVAGRKPDRYGQWLIDRAYEHRFSWSLIVPITLAASLGSVAPLLVGEIVIRVTEVVERRTDHSELHKAEGEVSETQSATAASSGQRTSMDQSPRTEIAGRGLSAVFLALTGLPLLSYAWFIRAYERERELKRNESEHSSGEFSRLMEIAAGGTSKGERDTSTANVVLRRTAIRQLQDFLNGSRAPLQCRSNSAAIFELFSSVVRAEFERFEAAVNDGKPRPAALDDARRNPLILTIGAVLRGVYGQTGRRGPSSHSRHTWSKPAIIVSANSLADLHFDLLDLRDVDFGGLDLSRCTFRDARLSHARFYGAVMPHADLSNAEMLNANLDGVQLDQALLMRANLSWSSMRSASLREARLEHAALIGLQLEGSDLSLSSFVGANLSMAALDLQTNLIGCNLRQAVLIGIQGLRKGDKPEEDEPENPAAGDAGQQWAKSIPGLDVAGAYWESDPQRIPTRIEQGDVT
ncbi:pentapeptide repeat-containing protein [uncultured Thiohalocapsa sp.]|uniref:pentapeptide repeat-containing protein n=1 Tax=uncultured Thiohalocapsa sp. TaxID=768990 RepID=UPI0025E53DC0|nr:pentapeptide repeat-containing protein [uncultured Thiohalocapsa sp.]